MRLVTTSLLIVSLAAGLAAGRAALAQTPVPEAWEYPLIKEYGKVRPYPEAKVQPDPQKEYKVIFNITRPAQGKDQIHPGLEQVARLLNLFALAGVPTPQLKAAVIVHGAATPLALDNQHYRDKFQSDNPNIELLKKLKNAEVVLYVCGQALAHNGLKPQWVNPDIDIALAALTVLPVYQLAGYALIPE